MAASWFARVRPSSSATSSSSASDHLWGFCAGCEVAEVCRGGCSWTAHVFFDRRGNNPYCHHRALVHAAHGLRGRVKQEQRASGLPFDNGVIGLIEEPLDAVWPEDDIRRFTLERVRWPESWLADEPDLVAKLTAERDRTIEVYRERESARA